MAIGTASELDIRIHHLVDPNKCYDFFRAKKWPHGVCCPKCTSNRVKKNGRKRSDPLCQNYLHSIEYKLRSQKDHFRWVTIKRIVSSHTYSTIQLPTTNGTVINMRKPGIPEGIHREIYDKLEVDYQHLPVRRNLV